MAVRAEVSNGGRDLGAGAGFDGRAGLYNAGRDDLDSTNPVGEQPLMTSNARRRPCPIWESTPSVQDIPEPGLPCTSPRAGGCFLLMQSGAPLFRTLTDRQKANLSYWIYKHNLEHRLFDEQPSVGKTIVVDQDWVADNQDRMPSASDRVLMWLRELIRCDDAGEERSEDLQMAAGSCRGENDLWRELFPYAKKMGWVDDSTLAMRQAPGCIHFAGRIFVEEQLGALGRSRQAFVAMWFDKSTEKAFKRGIEPAIEDAGYEARRIDQKEFLGKVDDEILAEIRKSRFVVADFTTSKKAGARGGVYYEAGFAQGLGIDVIYTCRKDRMEAVHFDTNHFNHITWKKPKDLRTQLQHRIEAVLGRGPLNPPTEQGGRPGDTLNEDA